MTSAQDSSVLFALDELRENERQRAAEHSQKARERAEVARRQAEAAAQSRAQAKKNAEELEVLRREATEKDRQRTELEMRLAAEEQSKRDLERRVRALPLPASPVILDAPTSILPHLAWASALLLSCAAVYLLAGQGEVGPVSEPMVLVEAADCPAPTPADSSPSSTIPTAEGASSTKVEPAQRGPRARPQPKPPRTANGAAPITIDPGACNGPLCGLPD